MCVEISTEQNMQLNVLRDFCHIFNDRPSLSQLYTCNSPYRRRFHSKFGHIKFIRRAAVVKKLKSLSAVLPRKAIRSCWLESLLVPSVYVLDARRINRIIMLMRVSSPPMDELLARFGGKSIFTSLYFTWQVPLNHKVRNYTAFVYGGRIYRFRVVPFGLNISNMAFGHALKAILDVP
jgi:hypothetical protein